MTGCSPEMPKLPKKSSFDWKPATIDHKNIIWTKQVNKYII